MRYKEYIESHFLIDDPQSGKLVPFIFRPVQNKYYAELCRDYDIEKNGISTPVREIILKARREGFSSFILALFACDDITQENPTETLVISYRDDATETFRRRYRNFVLSSAALQMGVTVEQIQTAPSILDKVAKKVLAVDSSDIILRHNKAHFYCGTASARVGGRGGVLQKLLFSEGAHYPDTEKMGSREIVDGTLRQVDINTGWVFQESTANGYGNYYEQTWFLAQKGETRFKPRFYGWKEMYTEEQFALISSEFADKFLLKQEYPTTPEEAFIASGTGFFDNELIHRYIKMAKEPIMRGEIELLCNAAEKCKYLELCTHLISKFTEKSNGNVKIWEKPEPGVTYIAGGDVSEGVEGDDSVLKIKNNFSLKTVASFASNTTSPDQFAKIVYALGSMYNFAYTAIESNKDGLWVNDLLFKMQYPNIYFREAFDDIAKTVTKKLGFRTDERTRPYILSELRTVLANYPTIWVDKDFLEQCIVFVRNKVGRPEAMSGKRDDHVMSEAIALEIRRNAPVTQMQPIQAPQTNEQRVQQKLEAKKAGKSNYSQQMYYNF